MRFGPRNEGTADAVDPMAEEALKEYRAERNREMGRKGSWFTVYIESPGGRPIANRQYEIVDRQTFRPEMVASKASVSLTTPWTSQTYFRPGLAVVMWPRR